MKKNISLILCLMGSTIGMLSDSSFTRKNFNINTYHAFNIDELSMVSHVYLGKKEVFCRCGRSPIIMLIIYGHLEVYCEEHAPDICSESIDHFRF